MDLDLHGMYKNSSLHHTQSLPKPAPATVALTHHQQNQQQQHLANQSVGSTSSSMVRTSSSSSSISHVDQHRHHHHHHGGQTVCSPVGPPIHYNFCQQQEHHHHHHQQQQSQNHQQHQKEQQLQQMSLQCSGSGMPTAQDCAAGKPQQNFAAQPSQCQPVLCQRTRAIQEQSAGQESTGYFLQSLPIPVRPGFPSTPMTTHSSVWNPSQAAPPLSGYQTQPQYQPLPQGPQQHHVTVPASFASVAQGSAQVQISGLSGRQQQSYGTASSSNCNIITSRDAGMAPASLGHLPNPPQTLISASAPHTNATRTSPEIRQAAAGALVGSSPGHPGQSPTPTCTSDTMDLTGCQVPAATGMFRGTQYQPRAAICPVENRPEHWQQPRAAIEIGPGHWQPPTAMGLGKHAGFGDGASGGGNSRAFNSGISLQQAPQQPRLQSAGQCSTQSQHLCHSRIADADASVPTAPTAPATPLSCVLKQQQQQLSGMAPSQTGMSRQGFPLQDCNAMPSGSAPVDSGAAAATAGNMILPEQANAGDSGSYRQGINHHLVSSSSAFAASTTGVASIVRRPSNADMLSSSASDHLLCSILTPSSSLPSISQPRCASGGSGSVMKTSAETSSPNASSVASSESKSQGSSTTPNLRLYPANRDKTREMRKWLLEHRDHPYPSRKQKQFLSRVTGLSVKQVAMWFANTRRQIHKVSMYTWSGGLYDTKLPKRVGNGAIIPASDDDDEAEEQTSPTWMADSTSSA